MHSLTRQVLAQLQGWLARPDTANTQLMIVTWHAVSVGAHDAVPDLAHAAVWALIHTAQTEHPERIMLLDTDETAASDDNLRRSPQHPRPANRSWPCATALSTFPA